MQVGGVGGSFDPAAMREMHQKMMSSVDTDDSSTLNLEEFSNLHAKLDAQRPDGVASVGSAQEIFAQIDTNGDGELTEAEMRTFRENNPPPPMLGSDTMASLLAVQEQSEDGWTSLLETLDSDDEEDSETTTDSEEDEDEIATSYFEGLSI